MPSALAAFDWLLLLFSRTFLINRFSNSSTASSKEMPCSTIWLMRESSCSFMVDLPGTKIQSVSELVLNRAFILLDDGLSKLFKPLPELRFQIRRHHQGNRPRSRGDIRSQHRLLDGFRLDGERDEGQKQDAINCQAANRSKNGPKNTVKRLKPRRLNHFFGEGRNQRAHHQNCHKQCQETCRQSHVM